MFDYDNEIEFVNYDSVYTTENDLDFMTEDHTYSDEWELNEDVIEIVFAKCENWNSKFGYNLEEIFNKAKIKQLINAIISVTGDDEIITTDDVTLVVMHLAVAEVISEITISVKDTGISRRKGNYTEGWVLLCPANEADFTSVVLRHQRDGIPLVFDITKLKATSAVRKQSSLEMDLTTKFQLLSKAAAWTDEDWFTYDNAQMSLIFSLCVFDFNDTHTYPFLYKEEGGCGGQPPWRNVHTALCTLRYFNKGGSTKSVLALMDECYHINEFNIKPSEALYVNASHYAQAGNENLSQISNAKRYLKNFDKESRLKILESCKGSDSLPQELIDKSVVVEVKDKLLGDAISELRSNHLIMTELDVQLKKIGLEKFSDLLKDENMSIVREKRERQKEITKKNGFTQLAKFSKVDVTLSNIEERALSIMARYYCLKTDYSNISSLTYAGILRVFKTTDVVEFYRRNSHGLTDEILAGISLFQSQNLNLKMNQAKEDLDYQISWLESGTLPELFDDEIPPSIGSDDARIARKVKKILETHCHIDEVECLIIVIVTDDKRLVRSLNKLYSSAIVKIERCSVYEYLMDCHKTISTSKVMAYNFLRGYNCRFDGMEKIIRTSAHWFNTSGIYYKILYDFPNVNRSLMGIISLDKKKIGKMQGGFLKRKTAKQTQFQLMEWDKFKELKDFDRTITEYRVR